MPKKNIYIAVDGGGTKTKVLIVNEFGYKIGKGLSGPSNIRFSVEQAWRSIYDAIDKSLCNTGIALTQKDYDFHIGFGLAGVSIVEAREKFLNTPNPFKTLILESDAHIACLGANEGKDGMIISVGTGIIGYSIYENHSYRVGGWGFPHADTGGGAWLGMEILRLTFAWLDGCISGSNVMKNIFARFDNNISNLVQWANSSNASQFATLVPYIVEGIKYEDPYSIRLFKKAANEVDLLITALIKKVGNAELPNSITGGVSRFIAPLLKTNNINVIDDKDIAVKGALYLIHGKTIQL